jgi:hypothetical protein
VAEGAGAAAGVGRGVAGVVCVEGPHVCDLLVGTVS